MAYKFGFTPEQVDRMDAVQVDEFITLLEKIAEQRKIEEKEMELV